jgi:hypothetical protein
MTSPDFGGGKTFPEKTLVFPVEDLAVVFSGKYLRIKTNDNSCYYYSFSNEIGNIICNIRAVKLAQALLIANIYQSNLCLIRYNMSKCERKIYHNLPKFLKKYLEDHFFNKLLVLIKSSFVKNKTKKPTDQNISVI